jgi:hypothetical protein
MIERCKVKRIFSTYICLWYRLLFWPDLFIS